MGGGLLRPKKYNTTAIDTQISVLGVYSFVLVDPLRKALWCRNMQQQYCILSFVFYCIFECIYWLIQSPVYYRIHKRTSPSLSSARSIHSASPSYFLKIRFNIILPCMPVPSKWSLPLRFPHQNPVRTSPLSRTCWGFTFRPFKRWDKPRGSGCSSGVGMYVLGRYNLLEYLR